MKNTNETGEVWSVSTSVVTVVYLSVIIAIGVFGNILVVIVSVQGNRVRTKGRALIASMAVADCVESLNLVFMLATAISRGQWIFTDAACKVHGFITTQFVIASMYSLMSISLNRYYMVVKPNHYRRVFDTRNTALIIAFIWVFPLWLTVSPLAGWSEYSFQPHKATCIFYFSTSPAFAIVVCVMCVPVPLTVIVYTCFKISQQVKQRSMRVQGAGSATRVNVHEIKITRTLIVIISAYLICFIPAAVVNLIEMLIPSYEIPFWIDIVSMLLVVTNHANNPLIYGMMNRQYRRAFIAVILGTCGDSCYNPNESNSDSRLDDLTADKTRQIGTTQQGEPSKHDKTSSIQISGSSALQAMEVSIAQQSSPMPQKPLQAG